MSYKNYDVDIVKRYKVRLVFWPLSVPFSPPSSLSTMDEVRCLLENLQTGVCRWKHLTPAQVQEHEEMMKSGELPLKEKKKKRSDAGKKRGPRASKENDALMAQLHADANAELAAGPNPELAMLWPTPAAGAKAGSSSKRKAGAEAGPSSQKKRKVAAASNQLPRIAVRSEFNESDSEGEDHDGGAASADGVAAST